MDRDSGTINAVYQKADEVIMRQIAGEHLLVPIKGTLAELQKLFFLEGIGEYVWSCIDGKKCLGDICRAVTERFDIDETQAFQDVSDFILKLKAAKLVTEHQDKDGLSKQ